MRPIIAAIHGIMTRQTVDSWVDRFDAWCYAQSTVSGQWAPHVVVKKEYVALPLPAFNVYAKNWFKARGLAAEIEGMVNAAGHVLRGEVRPEDQPRIHFVSHSNGTDIALKTIRMLARRGIRTEATVFVGSVLKADVTRNGVSRLIGEGWLKRAYAYCSRKDLALAVPRLLPFCAYGHLGITGWTYGKGDRWMPEEVWLQSEDRPDLVTRRYDRFGHGDYFAAENIEGTFAQFMRDLGLTTEGTEGTEKGPRISRMGGAK
jgi:hypothetical protein